MTLEPRLKAFYERQNVDGPGLAVRVFDEPGVVEWHDYERFGGSALVQFENGGMRTVYPGVLANMGQWRRITPTRWPLRAEPKHCDLTDDFKRAYAHYDSLLWFWKDAAPEPPHR